jgi:hypothetical protein
VSQEFLIRQATLDDVAVIGWHRARMFQDMGLVPDELFESFRTKALDRLSKALASGDYFGWLVCEPKAPPKNHRRRPRDYSSSSAVSASP